MKNFNLKKLNLIENAFNGMVIAVDESNGDVFNISEFAVRDYQGRSFLDNCFGCSEAQLQIGLKHWENEVPDIETSEMGDMQWAHHCDMNSDVESCIAMFKMAISLNGDWKKAMGNPIATKCDFKGRTPKNRAAKRLAYIINLEY
jgi:hypothetical protein